MYPENDRVHGLYYDPCDYLEIMRDGKMVGTQSAAIGFYHEAVHRLRNVRRPIQVAIRSLFHTARWSNLEEKRVILRYESKIADFLKEWTRKTDAK